MTLEIETNKEEVLNTKFKNTLDMLLKEQSEANTKSTMYSTMFGHGSDRILWEIFEKKLQTIHDSLVKEISNLAKNSNINTSEK